jgi:aryl-alcohol dehydrogenase-like predicted oxidoreductase
MTRFSDRYMTEENWRIVGELTAFAEKRGRTILELAFAWLLAHPWLSSVIAGATKPEQIVQNVQAASWKLSADDVAEVNRISQKV